MSEKAYFPASDHGRKITDPGLEPVLNDRRIKIYQKCRIIDRLIQRQLRLGIESSSLAGDLRFLHELLGTLYRNLQELSLEPDRVGSNLHLRAIQKSGL